MKPFLILQLRKIDLAADGEFQAFLKYGDLSTAEVHRVRMEKDGVPKINLEDYSGVIIGGGPNCINDKEQPNFYDDLKKLHKEIVEKDFPYLGNCYGLGFMTHTMGGEVTKGGCYAEPVGGTNVSLTDEGKEDKLLGNIDERFLAFNGHKEGVSKLPEGTVLLAKSDTTPVHMFRLKENIYATQFHCELDFQRLADRIDVYKHEGYFPPEEAEELKDKWRNSVVTEPMKILKNFVEMYKKD